MHVIPKQMQISQTVSKPKIETNAGSDLKTRQCQTTEKDKATGSRRSMRLSLVKAGKHYIFYIIWKCPE